MVDKKASGSRLRAAAGTAAFVLAIPLPVMFLVPWLVTGWEMPAPLPGYGVIRVLGALLVIFGLPLPASAMARFVRQGLGTPAPWAPTKKLVVAGPYVRVRNPMYIGVVSVIAGQGLFFGSGAVLVYASAVLAGFHLFVRLYEEPRLTRVYGPQYRAYCRRVPRWIPSFHGKQRL